MSYTPLEVCLRISKAGLTSPDWLPLLVVDLPFQEYVEQLLHPQDPASLGNGEPDPGSSGSGTLGSPLLPELLPVPPLLADTLYFFGDNNFTEWAPLFQHYSPPPFRLLGTTPAYSFGIAGGCIFKTNLGEPIYTLFISYS